VSYPLWHATQLSYARTPWSFIPNQESSGEPVIYQVYASIRRDGLTYGFANEGLLKAMFNPVNGKSGEKAGLGMDPAEFMREGERAAKYIPSHSCYWY
jgi:hypothetical protein